MVWEDDKESNCLATLYFNRKRGVDKQCDKRIIAQELKTFAVYLGDGHFIIGYNSMAYVKCEKTVMIAKLPKFELFSVFLPCGCEISMQVLEVNPAHEQCT